MKQRERDIIDAIDRVLRIPLPASGTQSTTVRGLSMYAHEMRQATGLACALIVVLRQGEPYEGYCRDILRELHQLLDDFDKAR